MKLRFVILGILMLTPLVWSACDSGQYGKKSKTEPKAKSETIPMAEAFMAPEEAGGTAENDEGVSHYKQGHFDVAQEHFSKALAANGTLAEAHYNLALALDKLGKHGEATAHFKMALELAPEDPKIRDSGILKTHVGG